MQRRRHRSGRAAGVDDLAAADEEEQGRAACVELDVERFDRAGVRVQPRELLGWWRWYGEVLLRERPQLHVRDRRRDALLQLLFAERRLGAGLLQLQRPHLRVRLQRRL